MNPHFEAAINLQKTLTPGMEVEVRWTNSYAAYRGAAKVVKVNKASVRVALLEEIPTVHGNAYRVGTLIKAPLIGFHSGMAEWSVNNGIFPAKV